jgi:hypothetical protein
VVRGGGSRNASAEAYIEKHVHRHLLARTDDLQNKNPGYFAEVFVGRLRVSRSTRFKWNVPPTVPLPWYQKPFPRMTIPTWPLILTGIAPHKYPFVPFLQG